VVTFLDITERRHMEEALRTSEDRLGQKTRIVDIARVPIFIWDFDGGIIDWNRGSEQLYGYSRDEAMGQRKDVLLGTSVPGTSFDIVRQELLKNGTWSGELHQVTKSGRALVVESQMDLVPVNGKRLVLESTRDVGDRKAWEGQQQLLLNELAHRVKNTLTV